MLVGPPYIAELFLPDFASQCFAGQLVWCIHRGLVCTMLARSLLVASLKPIALFAPLGCRKQKKHGERDQENISEYRIIYLH